MQDFRTQIAGGTLEKHAGCARAGGSLPAKPNLPVVRGSCDNAAVKITDDYQAKVRLWARQPVVATRPSGPPLPKFPAQKFRTHEEMNQWKQALLRELARSAARHG